MIYGCRRSIGVSLICMGLLLLSVPARAERYIVLGQDAPKGIRAAGVMEKAGAEVLRRFDHLDGVVADLTAEEAATLNGEGKVSVIPADLPLYAAEDIPDTFGHGTEVTGVLVGDKTGVCPYVQVVPVKAADDDGESYAEWLLEATDYTLSLTKGPLAGRNLIVNFSYSSKPTTTPNSEYEVLFQNILGQLEAQGHILFVTAAGNDGADLNTRYAYPASVRHDIHCSTAAHDSSLNLGDFSNYGSNVVDVAAPGDHMYTTDKDGGYTLQDGTSFSAPFVSGVAAYAWADTPGLTASAVKTLLTGLTEDDSTLPVLSGAAMAPDDLLLPAAAEAEPERLPEAWHLDRVDGLRKAGPDMDFSDVVCIVWDSGVDADHPDLERHLSMDLAYNATGDGTPPTEEPLTPGGGGCGIVKDLSPLIVILVLPYFLLSKH